MKLTWENLNRFQRNYVTRQTPVFMEVENNTGLTEEQKDVLFLTHYNELVKADYSNYKFPSSVPTSVIPNLSTAALRKKAAKTAPKTKAPAKAKAKKTATKSK